MTTTRQFIFKHSLWIGLVLGCFTGGVAYCLGGEDRVSLVGAAIAGTIGFFYFVQQQNLAETQLFHQLFTAFNARYDKLNGPLALIPISADPLSDSNRSLIVDYFNLCAEEYLFYKQGYIHPDVWRSWCRGMRWYTTRHPFKDIWHDEVKIESFYGLSLTAIEQGAT